MEWFFFLFISLVWGSLFFLARENPKSFTRMFIFALITLTFSLMLMTGISVPTGITSVTTGATTVQTITYTTYLATSNPATPNGFILLWALAWGFLAFGAIMLIYSFVMAYDNMFNPTKQRL